MKSIPLKLFHLFSRLQRGKTLGARVCAIDEQGRILLVRHSYVKGWTFPGGGVDKGESLKQAAIRELREEAAVEVTGPMHLHGMFSNEKSFPGDHVALFIAREFEVHTFEPNVEILEARFFEPAQLPQDTTLATRSRLAEILDHAEISDQWVVYHFEIS